MRRAILRLTQLKTWSALAVLVASTVSACTVGAGQTQQSQSGGTVTTTASDAQPDLTLDKAKQHTIDQINQFMAYIPDDSYTTRYTADEPMPLLSCQKDGYYYWMGNGQFKMHSDASTDDVVARIETDYQAKDGWQVEWRDTPGGGRYLRLIAPDTYVYYVTQPSPNATDPTFDVTGSSPCFPAPPNFDAARDY